MYTNEEFPNKPQVLKRKDYQ